MILIVAATASGLLVTSTSADAGPSADGGLLFGILLVAGLAVTAVSLVGLLARWLRGRRR